MGDHRLQDSIDKMTTTTTLSARGSRQQQQQLVRQLQQEIKAQLDRLDAFEAGHAYGDDEEDEDAPPRVFAGSLRDQETIKAQLHERMMELADLKNRLADAQSRKTVVDAKDEALEVLLRVQQVVEDARASAGRTMVGGDGNGNDDGRDSSGPPPYHQETLI